MICKLLADSIRFIFNIEFVFCVLLDVGGTSALATACVLSCAAGLQLTEKSLFMLVLSGILLHCAVAEIA